jgi:mannose-6-phosphate isomerase-like protein (cupin superfamily)
MPNQIRRVVTGHDTAGRSAVVYDDHAPNSKVLAAAGGLRRTELWETISGRAVNFDNVDTSLQINTLEPKTGGSIFRIVEYPPDKVRLQTLNPSAHFGGAADRTGERHPGMHKTNTIDYAIVLSGEIYAMLDAGEVRLTAGDCLIQRRTNHAWSNRTDKPCQIAFVMISAPEP